MARAGITCIVAALLALGGCTTAGPDYAAPALPSTGPAFVRAIGEQPAPPAARWWQELGDSDLSALIERGLAEAPQIDVAEARLRQARAGLTTARASLLPSLSASATYVYADLPVGGAGSSDFYSLGFDARWEADLWGGKRRSVEAAMADAGAAEARLADARVSLSAEIARTFINMRARHAAERLLAERLALENQLGVLAALRMRAGTAARQPFHLARQKVARTEGERAAVIAELAALRDALAVLSGQQPGALDGMVSGAVPLPPVRAAIGDPAGMLARRPDILAAERRLAAATARIGEANAKRFPNLSLMGLIGTGGTGADDVFDSSQLVGLALPRLTWNFLDFGRNKARVDSADAARDAALAEYRLSVLAALQDAEAALIRFGAARVTLARAGSVVGEGQEIARLQGLRAKAGTLSDSEAAQARIDAIDAQLAQVNARASLTLSYVALAKALGLGWQSEPTVSLAP